MEKNKEKIDTENKIVTEKDFYELWVRALKLNKDYKEFCLWLLDKSNRNSLIPEKFEWLCSIFFVFDNIFDPEWKFDEWYEWNRERLKKLKTPEAIEDLTEWIGSRIDEAIDSCKRHFNREPSIQELKEWLVENTMKKVFGDRLFLMVNVNNETVIEQFKRLVKKKKKDPLTKSANLLFIYKKYKRPIMNHKRIEEIKKYLDVYELKEQGLKPREVIEKHLGYEPLHEDAAERKYRRYYKNGKEIVKNAALGLFPHYEQNSPKNKNGQVKDS